MLDILLIDDEPEIRHTLADLLRDEGHRITSASDGAEAEGLIASRVFDVVITDIRLPRVDGLQLFRRLRQQTPSTDVILMTAFGDVGQAVGALKEGAFHYLTKPFDIDEVLLLVKRIAATRDMRRQLEEARRELSRRPPDDELIGRSPVMAKVQRAMEMVGHSDAPTLIVGESGTGKKLIARLLHQRSERRAQPFVIVNCAAFPDALIEAELFGYEKGAVPGATRRRDGRLQSAHGGTIVLDEISELPLPTQAKLLRLLQESRVEPVGGRPVPIDVRVISATHRNLRELTQAGAFLQELHYAINVLDIAVPPLRERPGDLPFLIQHFLVRYAPTGRPPPNISPDAYAALSAYAFPGNVRELAHAIEHAVLLADGDEITLDHLPAAIAEAALEPLLPDAASDRDGDRDSSTDGIRPLALALRDFERTYLARALAAAGGKRVRAAEMLGISRKSLWEKLRLHGIGQGDGAERAPVGLGHLTGRDPGEPGRPGRPG